MAKKLGRHPEKALSALKIKHLGPGRHADGNGLHLVVDESGAKRWLLRITIQGRRSDLGLGSLSLVSLAEAREKALEHRKIARSGGDPLAERRKAKKVIPTFKAAAEAVHAEHKITWKNAKHSQQWINTLTTYAFPIIGSLPVDKIGTPEVLKVLMPIWLTKSETASRVRQRMGTVFDWAKAAGHRSGENPVDGVEKGLPKQIEREEHHASMPFAKVGKFIQSIRSSRSNTLTKLAFEFLILTASRTGEILGARWEEVDREASLWVVPAIRMKAKKEHRVPLTPRCIEILDEAAQHSSGSEYIFPGRSLEKPLSNMAFAEILKGMELKVTVHGFRSSFRDWAAEETAFPREVAEMALAHSITNKVEAAYRRGDLLDKRRELMCAWADFVTNLQQNPDDKH